MTSRIGYLCLIWVIMTARALGTAESYVFTIRDKEDALRIVVPETTPEQVSFAVGELRHYLHMIFGREFAVKEASVSGEGKTSEQGPFFVRVCSGVDILMETRSSRLLP